MKKDVEFEIENADMAADTTAAETTQQAAASEAAEEQADKEAKPKSTLDELRQRVTEDDDAPISTLTLRKILGGDYLSAAMVRRQVWLCLLIGVFLTIYVAFRYQCQQDMIDIAQLENQLGDAKYKALSSSSQLTERCRESHVLEMLRAHNDSTLNTTVQPPYKIQVPTD